MKNTIVKFLSAFLIFAFSSTTLDAAKTDDSDYFNDVYWLSLNIYFESGNQPTLGKIAVGMVTLNRVRDNRFSNTIENVIKEYKQFSWYDPKKKNYIPKNEKVWNECVSIAKLILSLDQNHAIMKMFDDITHFHNLTVEPEWIKSMIKVTQIGDHIFYKMSKRK